MPNSENALFLPATPEEYRKRGWDHVDIVLVTGDAYIDHPSFGIALIGRWLEANGYKVAILSQPNHKSARDFKKFGRPRLFFGISAGNLDSVVANYTGNARVRKKDAYSPEGNPYFRGPEVRSNRRRPDRAVIKYSNLARQAYPDVPVVLGGIEASLRRFVHYDFQQERLRNSVLADSKADILVYGMGERAVLEIAKRIENGQTLDCIPGTCIRLSQKQLGKYKFETKIIKLPGWDEIARQKSLFLDAELAIDKAARSGTDTALLQQQKGGIYILQNRPAEPLTQAELDALYELPFARETHPLFKNVPALDTVRESVTIVRGCSGNCSFCAIARHQGPIIISRSVSSVLKEVRAISNKKGFKGTITDLGGPTANLYGASCEIEYRCKKKDCLYPAICKSFKLNEEKFRELLRKAKKIPGVKHVFVSSGLRIELLLKTPELLKEILLGHTPGMLKIAPEHTERDVLQLMHKYDALKLDDFLKICRQTSKASGKKVEITAYFMTSHPGCTVAHMESMQKKLKKLRLAVRQFQDFTPTPGTLSTAMYVTGLGRYKKEPIYVARKRSERKAQRRILETLMQGQRPGF